MSTLKESYLAMAKLNLWFKIQDNESLKLIDIPSILPLRWNYFKFNWEFIKPILIESISSYENPDLLSEQIETFSLFIESQRTSTSKLNPFSDSIILNKYYSIFDNIEIDAITLSSEEERLIEAAVITSNNMSKNDFLKIKNTLRGYRDRYTDTVSLWDNTYNKTFNRASIPPEIDPIIENLNLMKQMQDGIVSVELVLANLFAVDTFLDPFSLARENANNEDIDIGQYASGNLVRLEVGQSLQSLATNHLGDPLKWIDIAIANGLKAPYIDETGERIPLISNGNGNLLNLSGVDFTGNLNIEKLYINQVIYLKSDVEVVTSQRKIINIRQIPVSNEIILEVDGPDNLSDYQLTDAAYIRVYKPNTVNSSVFILIPSTEPLANPRNEEVPWFLASSPESERQAKVDLAVSTTGDLILSSDGDLAHSFGIANALQAIQFIMQTEQGGLALHPDYGLLLVAGERTDNISDIISGLEDSVKAQIANDPRFESVENLNIEYNNEGASVVTISLEVRLAGGGNQVIPISFNISV